MYQDIWETAPQPEIRPKLVQPERLTQMQAARANGYTITEYDNLDMWTQAEVLASYLTQGRIEEVQAYRAKRQAKSTEGVDPFETEDG